MAFGQAAGPPAGGRQMAELLALLQEAGHTGFRDARGPMGFTQRQGNGTFTADEADGFIAQLHEAAETAPDETVDGEASPAEKSPPRRAKRATKPDATPLENPSYTKALRKVPDEQLVAELTRRGWTVEAPDAPAF